MKYPEVQKIVARYIVELFDMRLIHRYTVLSYNYFYRFALIEIEYIKNGRTWLVAEIVHGDIDEPPCLHVLRECATKQRADIIYTALTEL